MSEIESLSHSLDEIQHPEPGPRPTTSLRVRRSPLADPQQQIARLQRIPLDHLPGSGDFGAAVATSGLEKLVAGPIEILQINLGKLCNMSCRHCHVDAGPDRWREAMSRDTVDACLGALDQIGARTVDLTGGAPELNPNFRYLVNQCVRRGKQVIDRCNLTVLLLKSCSDLPIFLADHGVEVVCSLPHYRRRNTDSQRGEGAFERSVKALDRLNAVGYGSGDPERTLTLMVNPVGAILSGDQASMERQWKRRLERDHGVTFDRLIALNNMPIARFLEWLDVSDNLEGYMELLVNSYNPATLRGLMCRNTVSVSWDGRIFDCDFNQMLELESRGVDGSSPRIESLVQQHLENREIITGRHCFGCTAGAGSSCAGALHETVD